MKIKTFLTTLFIISLTLALILPSNLLRVKAADNGKAPDIFFDDKSTAKNIVAGTSTKLEIEKLSGDYKLNEENPITIKSRDGTVINPDKMKYNPISMEIETVNDAASGDAPKTFDVNANYYSENVNGDAWEIIAGRRNKVDVTFSLNDKVVENSTITLTAISDEADKSFGFKVKSGATGVFKNVSTTSEFTAVRKGEGEQPIEFAIDGGKIYITSKQKTTDAAGKETYKITKNTEFSVTAEAPKSKSIALTVYPPQAALDFIKNAVESDTEEPFKYILLNQGINKDTSLNAINSDFNLLTALKELNATFTIKWKWAPNKPEDMDVVKISTPDTKKATVNKKQENVSGKLQGEIQCIAGGTQPIAGLSSMLEVGITIEGYGIPPVVTLTNQTINAANTPIQKPSGSGDKWQTEIDRYTPNKLDLNEGKKKPTDKPYEIFFNMFMGGKNGTADYAIIEATPKANADAVEIVLPGGVIYTFGNQIVNDDKVGPVNKEIKVRAKTAGKSVKLTFKFYRGTSVIDKTEVSTNDIYVDDTNLKKDATLKSLTIKKADAPTPLPDYSPNLKPDFGSEIKFDLIKDKYEYDIDVPYEACDTVQLFPIVNEAEAAKKPLDVTFVSGNGSTDPAPPKSGGKILVNLPNEGSRATVTIKVTAEDSDITKTYTLNLTRSAKSNNANVKGVVLSEVGSKENLIKDFSPAVNEYKITLPYKTRILKLSAIAEFSEGRAKLLGDAVDKDGKPTENKLNLELNSQYVKLSHPLDKNPLFKADSAETVIIVRGISEEAQFIPPLVAGKDEISNKTVKDYRILVTREEPSAETALLSFEAVDKRGEIISLNEKFDGKLNKPYDIALPFGTDAIKFKAAPQNLGATMKYQIVNVETPPTDAEWKELTSNKLVDFKNIPYEQQGQEFKTLYIKTTAENETDSEVYAFRITRAKPNDQTLLEKLVLKDQNKAVIPFDFTLDGVNFSKDVPYEVTDVIFNILPVSKDVGKITIKYEDERSVTAGNDSIPYKLKDSNTTAKFVIKVTAQDTTKTKEYTFSIRRLPPTNDCLLKDLILGDSEKFAPPFTPSQLNYKAEVVKGKKEVSLTPITHNDKATIKINGAPAKSGEAFKVDVLEIKTKILVEVTAQNGRDRKTYKIDMLNPNLQNKSSNADLDFLEVDNGVLDPPFSPSITTYNVAVKDDVAYVSLNAQAADSLAQMTMFSDSREVGDANGNLKEYIPEGQTGFKIEVISPDSTKTKEYTINVFRKDETNSGTLKPISAEEVNFDVSGDVVVDISKYPIVSSEIFETIKKKHPDKSITFVGNDYSLQFKGSDLSKLNIPYETNYDFSLKFISPDEDKIREALDKWEQNGNLTPITIYFGYHGVLPAPATLNVSLGERYKNVWMGWHYYNEERDRIDYLGKFATNFRGNFSVPITHMSTYMAAPNKIVGSENKAVADGVLSAPPRINPSTGVGK